MSGANHTSHVLVGLGFAFALSVMTFALVFAGALVTGVLRHGSRVAGLCRGLLGRVLILRGECRRAGKR